MLIDTNGESISADPIPDRSLKMIKILVELAESFEIRVLLSGSYRSLGGPSGGYLTGDRGIVEELRYSSRCYMFSTSPLPVHMAMISATLQTRHNMAGNKKGFFR
jgi:7-keto-8-aminopelargonate synthetase-like enzyme